MLFQQHSGHDDQGSQRQGRDTDTLPVPQCFTVSQGHMNSKGIKYMNTWKDIGRSIRFVQPFHNRGK